MYRLDTSEGGRVLDLAILGLLHESSMHGYELRKQLNTKLGAIRAAISYGSLYPTLRRLQAAGLISEGAYVARGEDRYEVGSFKEAMKWLFEQAKRGQTIQRYKGLGEMNPEQLWDTTINPDTRRLMQVKIDDAVAADDIFTTLMGDQVEPRREFIEKNALSVMNLDV